MEQQVPGAAGDPALPRARRRPLRPAPGHPACGTAGHERGLRRGHATRGRSAPTDGEVVTARFLISAVGCLSAANVPPIPGLESLRGRLVPHRGLAPRRGRLLRQAGRPDRYRLDGDPGHAGHRRAGRPPHRLPAHAQLQRSGPQLPDVAGADQRDQGQLRRDPPEGPRRPSAASRTTANDKSALEVSARGAAGDLRAAVGRGGRLQVHLRLVQRPADQPGGQRHRGRVHPEQDPPDRQGSGGGGEAGAQGLPLRHEATADRHPLLRDVQPRQRDPGRPARGADRGDHADRHPHHGPGLRPRHHRVRHRLRRHDRVAAEDRHPGPRRPAP